MSYDIKFDAERHIYTIGDRTLISVTTAIKNAGLIDVTWFTDEARERGKAVHEAIFLDIFDDLDFDDLHPIIRGYFDGWLKFKHDTGFIPVKHLCERPQYHPEFEYVGMPDLLGRLNGRYAVIDAKTGDASTAPVQTAAYEEFPMIKAFSPDRFSLRLYKDGKYKLNRHDSPNDFLVFLDCLKIAKAM